MKKTNLISLMKKALLLLLLAGVLLACAACGGPKYTIAVDGKLAEGATIEYTGGKIQFPVAYVADRQGNIVSYNVLYKVINLADQSEMTDEYAAFELKPGAYQIIYTYGEDENVSKTVSFSVVDTTAPKLEFIDIPNGLFLQDITADTINKLPLYTMEDASSGAGIDLKQTLKFKGEGDADFKEYPFRKLNNSYEINTFGVFIYELTATDSYGNSTTIACQWKVKDRTWKPDQALPNGVLADYSEDGYCNLVEGGDANQYYKIDNDYSDSYLSEFQGAQGVLKIVMGFNNAAGYGNNTIRLRIPKTFTKEDLAGKYLAIRIYVEGEHLKDTFLFGGNNVEFREADATTRAFTTGMTGLKTGKWMTFYLEAATVENIGMYPNATYNPNTTFYEGGDPADAIQLCFHREAGYFNDMTLYIDSISIAEFLPDTKLTISGNEASWTAVEGATGYQVILNGEETIVTGTSISLPGQKGYIRVTPLGNGTTMLDAKTVTGVYGLDAGDSIAKFDDPLYAELFNDRLAFSSETEHNGYRPGYLNGSLTSEGLAMEIGTGAWGVVTGVRFQFPKAAVKGNNTTLVLNMKLSSIAYHQVRVYDYSGTYLTEIEFDADQANTFCEFEVDISSYNGTLEGIQLIFGPNEAFTSVSEGVTVVFKEISLKNSYYSITVDGQELQCAGTRDLNVGYTADTLVQFVNFYNFGVPTNDTPLGFSGTVLIDGRKINDVTVVGYPNLETICFKGVPHKGKVLTIMKDSVIYYGGIAVKIAETCNATWNGSHWTLVDKIPDPAAPQQGTLTLAYRYGADKLIQFNTNLPTSIPCVNFTAGDNGCSIDQSANQYQQVGWIQMAEADGTIVLTFHFNNAFAAGQTYVLSAGSVFSFTDGSKFTLDKDYAFQFDGSSWSVVEEAPKDTSLTFQYRWGNGNVLQVNTNLPATTPVANFLATDNGCSIDQSGNQYQQVGWIQMHNPDETGGVMVLTFHFNKDFEAGQTYVLPAGAVFGFTDGNTYVLDANYTFTWDGNNWNMTTN